eukprot:7391304-Prymnesium_polylepis.1
MGPCAQHRQRARRGRRNESEHWNTSGCHTPTPTGDRGPSNAAAMSTTKSATSPSTVAVISEAQVQHPRHPSGAGRSESLQERALGTSRTCEHQAHRCPRRSHRHTHPRAWAGTLRARANLDPTATTAVSGGDHRNAVVCGRGAVPSMVAVATPVGTARPARTSAVV